MHSTMNFIYAGFWTLVLAAWLIPHKRLVPMIEAKFARPVFNTDPKKTSSIIHRVVAGLLMVLVFESFLSAVNWLEIERIAANLTAA